MPTDEFFGCERGEVGSYAPVYLAAGGGYFATCVSDYSKKW